MNIAIMFIIAIALLSVCDTQLLYTSLGDYLARRRGKRTRKESKALAKSIVHLNPKILKKGFTIVEVMIVVAIIGLLAAIIIPLIFSVKDTATHRGQTLIRQEEAGVRNTLAKQKAVEVKATDIDICMFDELKKHSKIIAEAEALAELAKAEKDDLEKRVERLELLLMQKEDKGVNSRFKDMNFDVN